MADAVSTQREAEKAVEICRRFDVGDDARASCATT